MQDSPEEYTPFVDVAETHSGAVLFIGDRAYKIKKPLDLGFVDYRTVESRRTACEEEVRLNRRLAPDVYLGVGSLSAPGHEEPVVVMRRLPAGRRLSQLIAGGDGAACIEQLAQLLATFHGRVPRTEMADLAASTTATASRWEQNTTEMRPFEGRYLPEGLLDELLAGARRYLAGRETLLQHRIDSGRARDGHGDLLAQDIFCGDDGPAVLDCLEFDAALRAGDVLADVAFLAMDLERLGRPELSWRFLERHRELLGDDWPVSLAHHHIAYRAQVRAKVACIRAAQGVTTDEDPGLLLQLASQHLARARVELVMIGGLPGSGKSTVAAELARRRGAMVLSSDEVRKELAGIAPLESAAAPPGEGIYDAEHTERTYAELVRRARRALQMGERVVLDASFTDPASRVAPQRLAEEVSAALFEFQCVAPPAVLEDRVTRRAAAGPSTSDADRTVLDALARRAAPWPRARPLDTTRALDETVAAAMGVIDPTDDARTAGHAH